MADAADAEHEYVTLSKFFQDEDLELKATDWPAQGGYGDVYGNNPNTIIQKFEENKQEAETLQWWVSPQTPAQWWFFSSMIPKYTGVSTCFLSFYNNANYDITLFDKDYKMNPKAAPSDAEDAWNAKFTNAFAGFKPQPWECTVEVTNEDLTTTKKQEAQNDNLLFWHMSQFDGSDAKLREIGKMKFSFAGNKGYKIVQSKKSGKNDMALAAIANGECFACVKTVQGIFAMNWAALDYKGDRKKYASLNKGWSEFLKIVGEMNQYGFITIDGDGY